MVTVSDKDERAAFKLTVTEDPHFETIKNDSRSRVQDTAITAEALLPDGPYNLWKGGETSRRVKDLAGAFAQLPHLPKMLKSQAIVETLVAGCEQGTFVLKLTRPDRTFRTWWRSRPDDAALSDPAMELVLPDSAELGQIPGDLLAPKALPDLWGGDEITVQAVIDYFDGAKVVQVDKGGFTEPAPVPKAPADVVETAVNEAVEAGKVWLFLTVKPARRDDSSRGFVAAAKLRVPPAIISAAAILPENLPGGRGQPPHCQSPPHYPIRLVTPCPGKRCGTSWRGDPARLRADGGLAPDVRAARCQFGEAASSSNGRRWWRWGRRRARPRPEDARGPSGTRAVRDPGLGRPHSATASDQDQDRHAAEVPRPNRVRRRRAGPVSRVCRFDQRTPGKHPGRVQDRVTPQRFRCFAQSALVHVAASGRCPSARASLPDARNVVATESLPPSKRSPGDPFDDLGLWLAQTNQKSKPECSEDF